MFALLVVACFVAFFVTQRLKHTPTAVQAFKLTPRFSPDAGRPHQTGADLLQARAGGRGHGDDHRLGGGDVVATLVRDHPVPRYKQLSLRWNGRRGHGARLRGSCRGRAAARRCSRRIAAAPAPAGEYRVRVTLREQHRSVLSPRSFTLVRP